MARQTRSTGSGKPTMPKPSTTTTKLSRDAKNSVVSKGPTQARKPSGTLLLIFMSNYSLCSGSSRCARCIRRKKKCIRVEGSPVCAYCELIGLQSCDDPDLAIPLPKSTKKRGRPRIHVQPDSDEVSIEEELEDEEDEPSGT